MSASVDQKRSKGQSNQVSNGPQKDTVKEGEFDAYLQSQPAHGGYGSAPMSSPNVQDQYGYYQSMSFPYVNQSGLAGDHGAWSNGSDPMSFLGGYGGQMSDNMYGAGMFNFGGYGQANFNWSDFPTGDYNAWGNGPAHTGRKGDDRYQEGYYMPAEGYSMNNEADMKSVEQGLKGVTLSGDGKGDSQKDDHHHHHHHHKSGGHHSSSGGSSGGGAPPTKKSWASIASQPAKPQPQLKAKTIPRAPLMPNKHNMDIGTWDNRNNSARQGQQKPAWGGGRGGRSANAGPYASGPPNSSGSVNSSSSNGNSGASSSPSSAISHPVLDKLKSTNLYNPKSFDLNPKGARFFIIKSYSEDDIHRSIKYSIWCSTDHGNKRLDGAFREREGKGSVYLLYSVNGSGHFCGMAQMMTPINYNETASVWAQDKWRGRFEVKWIYVKDVPNSQLRHIRLENNENKPVTNSRDTQEVPQEKGKQVLKTIHNYRHTTSIFDDFGHYEKRQEEDVPAPPARDESDRPPQKEERRGGEKNGERKGRNN